MYAVKPTIAPGPISQSQPSSDAVEIAPTSNRPNSPVAAAPTSISRPPAIISSDTTTIGCRGSGTRRAKTDQDGDPGGAETDAEQHRPGDPGLGQRGVDDHHPDRNGGHQQCGQPRSEA